MNIKVGCCGFPISMKKYFMKFKLVEIQKTFYEPPKTETLIKWRASAPENFEFSIKAWQVLTHPCSSPTWQRMKIKLKNKEDYGFLKPNEENFKAWEKTLEDCKALKAKICIVQTPPTFSYTLENINNMKRFFNYIKRDEVKIAWEPRGNWVNHLSEVKMLCEKLNLIHVVDPLKREPAAISEIQYFRLHGLHPKKEVNYKYQYSIEDLKKLHNKIMDLSKFRVKEVYVLFNNLSMGKDAEKFLELTLIKGESFS
jgi:uncharacterized protein YecE (DUF72 family)